MLRLGAMAIAAALVLTGGAASAADCGARDKVLKGFLDQYGESPVATMSADGGGSYLITASPKGTWTMLAEKDDQLCGIGVSGDHWQAMAPPTEAPKPAPGSVLQYEQWHNAIILIREGLRD